MTLFRVDSLTKHFGGLVAVNNLSFQIQEKEIVGLIGPNGAGKTTVFNLISGILSPDHGHIFMDGKDITELRVHTELDGAWAYLSDRPALRRDDGFGKRHGPSFGAGP